MDLRVPALSLRQPWAWAVLFLGKDVENRSRYTKRRGAVWLHASAQGSRRQYELDAKKILELGFDVPAFGDVPRGALVGGVCITDSVRVERILEPSRWAIPGCEGWTLADRWISPVVPGVRGSLGFWQLKNEDLAVMLANGGRQWLECGDCGGTGDAGGGVCGYCAGSGHK